MDIGIADGVHAYGDDAVPLLADIQGFRGALLLVDEVTGHAIIEAIWRGPAGAGGQPRRRYGPTWPSRPAG